jgi:hypothetical protein
LISLTRNCNMFRMWFRNLIVLIKLFSWNYSKHAKSLKMSQCTMHFWNILTVRLNLPFMSFIYYRGDVVSCLSEHIRNDTLMEQEQRIEKSCRKQLRFEVMVRVRHDRRIMHVYFDNKFWCKKKNISTWKLWNAKVNFSGFSFPNKSDSNNITEKSLKLMINTTTPSQRSPER